MEAFTTFLANNYLWFLVIAIILIFALIGYFVDANEQKKGISSIVKQKPVEKDIHDLAKEAGNKSLNSAINATNTQNMMPNLKTEQNNVAMQNTITEMNQNMQNSNANPVGFDVLKK